MSWVGSIVGEFLVSKEGLGYLIVYGSQVFKLDLVMSSVLILCLIATIMYYLVLQFEKIVLKSRRMG
jgi:NitT/TauT family transport system permease protein